VLVVPLMKCCSAYMAKELVCLQRCKAALLRRLHTAATRLLLLSNTVCMLHDVELALLCVVGMREHYIFLPGHCNAGSVMPASSAATHCNDQQQHPMCAAYYALPLC
jgi:hypothetical protein